MEGGTPVDKTNRQMIELLNELRVALPGVQILLGFLLTVPFSARFDELSRFQKDTLGLTILLTALSTACLIAPSAAHRIRFGKGDRAWLIESASRLLLAGLFFLALAIVAALVLVGDVLYDGPLALVGAVLVLVVIVVLWLVRPLLRHRP
jgi:hypothetical protein